MATKEKNSMAKTKWDYKLVRIDQDRIIGLDELNDREDEVSTRLNKLLSEGWEVVEFNIRELRAGEPMVVLLRRERGSSIGFAS